MPETVSNFENSPKSPEHKKRKDSNITVLVHDGLCVERYKYGYIVTALRSAKTKKGTVIKQFDHIYHAKLPDAMIEVSERLFDRKLVKRSEAEQSDFESLIQLVRDHKTEIDELFGV